MKKILISLLAALLLFSCSQAPVQLIFETDMGNDVDDAVALSMIHTYISQGKAELIMVGINKDRPHAPAFVKLMDTFYGRPDIPIGMVQGGVKENEEDYAKTVCTKTDESGKVLYPGGEIAEYPDAVSLYRKTLAKAKKNSVVIASVGFSTNLARLLESGPDEISPLSGVDLVAKKVSKLVVMAGGYPNAKRKEYNVIKDIPAAKIMFSKWPTDMWISPWELGDKVRYPATSIVSDYGWVENHPLVDAYEAYLPMPYDRPMWDPTAVMCAVEGEEGFTIDGPFAVSITDDGCMVHTDNPAGKRYMMSVDETQAAAVLARIIDLAKADSRN